MRGSLLTALRRWTSTPVAAGDLFKISPRSGALRVGEAWLAMGMVADGVTALTLPESRGAVDDPRLSPAGAVGGAVSAVGGVGASPGAVPGGSCADGGSCWDGGTCLTR